MPTALTLTPVKGPVNTPLGEKPANGRLYLALRRADRQGDTTVVPHVVEIALDADGDFNQAVWACQLGTETQAYAAWVEWFSLIDNKLKTAALGYAVVPDDPAGVDLADLWTNDAPDFLPGEVLAQCVAAALVSQAAAVTASTARNEAVQALADTVAVAASVTDQNFVEVAFIGNDAISTIVFPGIYPEKKNFIINAGGLIQNSFTISVGSTTTTLNFSDPFPPDITVNGRVSKRLVTPVADAPSNLTVGGLLLVGGARYGAWTAGNADIDALMPGTAFGSLVEASDTGHHVIALRENDTNDSFAIVSGGGNYASDSVWDTLVALFKANGNVGIGIDPTAKLHVAGTLKVDGLVSGVGVTQTATDSTAGRLLKVGDFGLGTAIALGAGKNLNDMLTSGFYYNPSSGNATGNNYPFIAAGSLVVVARSATNVTQRFSAYPGGSSLATQVRVFERSYGGAGFSPWVEMFHQGTILGTVSQSGGVPTGRVIERGSNANGEFTRYADGTQDCYRVMAASAGAGVAWTFPVAFSVAPIVGGTAVATVLSSVQLDAAPSTTAATLSARDKADARRADVMHLFAKGRWF